MGADRVAALTEARDAIHALMVNSSEWSKKWNDCMCMQYECRCEHGGMSDAIDVIDDLLTREN